MPEHSLPRAVAALFPSPAERARLDGRLTEALIAALARVRRGPVTPTVDMARFVEELAAMDFDAPHKKECQSMIFLEITPQNSLGSLGT